MALIKTRASRYPTFWDRFSESDWMDWSNSNFSTTNTTIPSANIMETDDEFDVELAAPGMKKEDFNINLDNGWLTVSAEKETQETDDYSRREFSYESFQRTFSIPENMVDEEKIDAKYQDGILRIHLPKAEHAKTKPARVIEVG